MLIPIFLQYLTDVLSQSMMILFAVIYIYIYWTSWISAMLKAYTGIGVGVLDFKSTGAVLSRISVLLVVLSYSKHILG